jgi:hypothetical protein
MTPWKLFLRSAAVGALLTVIGLSILTGLFLIALGAGWIGAEVKPPW